MPGTLDPLLASLASGGRDFEQLCKWLLENDPMYRKQVARVWLWEEWPGRNSRDIGIDLVAGDRDGGLWAIQAKHYDPAYSIKKADLDSFLSASSRADFTYRLLIATTDHLGPNARTTIAHQEKPVGTILRSQLDLLEVAWPTSISHLRPAKPKRKKPRPHQRRAIKDCVQGLAQADRGQMVMACGTGKTLVGPFLADAMEAKRVLVLVPSLSLLGQTLREWATATEFDYLAVCSDDTVTKDEHDAVVASTSELGVPVTTEAARIARFLRRRGPETKVIFSTYQSSPQVAAAQKGGVPAFDLVIADEAHRCAGPQAGAFATVLDPAKIKARKRLFMTATPRYFTGRVKREAREADWEVASMDEEEKFGTVLHRLSFAQAIDQDLLSDYQVVVVGVSDSEAHDLADRGAFVTSDGETVTDARTLARQIGLLRSMAKYDLHRVVSFHSRIDNASRFAASLHETKAWLPARRRPQGTLWTDHVSGKMTAGERDARLRRLKAVEGDERGVLTNARCLTEGVDVPTLDGIAFIDPRSSQVDIVQAVGRAIRKTEDKTVGTIVIPVFVTEHDDPVEALESSEFNRVWEVIRALRDHDEELADELDELRRGLARRGTLGKRPAKLVLDLPAQVGSDFARAFDATVVKRGASRWQRGFGHSQAYWQANGHLRVPVKYRTQDGFPLGDWLAKQRGRKTSFSTERVAALDAIGMVWHRFDEAWWVGLSAAQQYVTEHGDLLVPGAYTAPDGYKLGLWINNQRVARRRGNLSDERAAALDALRMVWDPLEEEKRRALAAARAFREQHGNLRVPKRHRTDDGFDLGQWLARQRRFRRAGLLPPDEAAQLDELGMVWDPHDTAFERGLEHSRRYVQEHGHLRVATGGTHDGFALGIWIRNQRDARRRGKLTNERVAALDGLGMSWDPLGESWRQGIEEVQTFRSERGHLRVPDTYVTTTGFPLGGWILRRRNDRRVGRLTPERIAELDALGMTWELLEDDRRRYLSAARAYHDEYGDLRVPTDYVAPDGLQLAAWIKRQRIRRRGGKLAADRIAELDDLGMIWSVHELRWQECLAAARSYLSRNGHLRVPVGTKEDGIDLRAWVNRQRLERRRGTLAPERVTQLDALGFVWEPASESAAL